jgi:hypothetical protein
MDFYGRMGRPAMQFLRTLANTAASSATAALGVTSSCFVAGALGELSVALVHEVVYREALRVYTTAGCTAAHAGAVVSLLLCVVLYFPIYVTVSVPWMFGCLFVHDEGC